MPVSNAGPSWLRKQRQRLREQRNRLVDQQLRQLERIRRQVREGVDVVVLGDSSCLFGRPDDADPAMIPELIGRELGGARVAVIAGPGYTSQIHGETLRILGTLEERPTRVVSSVCVRTAVGTHVAQHPVYRYQSSLAAMRRITSARHRIRSFGRGTLPTPEDYAEFKALPVHSRWSGDTTIGAFRAALEGRGPKPWPPELERILFDYFHGEVITPDAPGVAALSEFGRQIDAYGVPTVSYLTGAPIERGERNYPGEFADLARANLALVEGALRETAGPQWQLVDVGLEDDDFVYSPDATEHFSLQGRRKIARGVAAALND